MKTTVVIATRNRAGELARTLRELAGLRPRPPIIVVDNASTDDTAEVVRAAGPEVRLLTLPRNLGAAARNLGVTAARTPYVAFSDDDSWWAPDALAKAESLFDRHPRLGLIAGKTLVGPENRPDPVVELMARSPLGREPGSPGPAVLGFLACSAMVRVRAYSDCGGFDPLLHFGAEEKLLSYDLAARGWQLCYVEEIVAHHHPSPSRMPAARRRRLEARNNLLITWLRRAPKNCLAATVSAPPRAVAGAARRLPKVLRRRQRLPRAVEARVRLLEGKR
ncbi:glycosyltransferase family 2 protein [Amycolatopsis sp. YIM 10]|uniref:glycosyltransferase family 2 protein n=1 Tax=Amycolatopsis sp. YIM 10 TaxID=2653857 RepID=UPI00128FEF4F|nr:glycosyltransferase [Amycolatopsis sp. YIM 10]QFU91855.1 putative glycosyl transferase [Amycolatopsis sp. YIM 10]